MIGGITAPVGFAGQAPGYPMVLLARTEHQAQTAWNQLQREFAELHRVVNQEKSRLTTTAPRRR
jgi:hypothetical protein